MNAAWAYTLIPAAVTLLAAVIAVNLRPGAVLVSAIQHFAAVSPGLSVGSNSAAASMAGPCSARTLKPKAAANL